MGIFEQLYNGEIYIDESNTPKTEKYKTLRTGCRKRPAHSQIRWMKNRYS